MNYYDTAKAYGDDDRTVEERMDNILDVEDLNTRLDMLAELAWDISGDEGADAQNVANELGAHEVVGVDVAFAMDYATVLHELARFVEETDYLDEGSTFRQNFGADAPPHPIHNAYWTLQTLYGWAITDHLDNIDDRIKNAVYARMYELVHDPRPIAYQMDMDTGFNCIGPKGLIDGETDIEWSMENVDRIARELIKAWLGVVDDVGDQYDEKAVADYDGLDDIIGEVEGRLAFV